MDINKGIARHVGNGHTRHQREPSMVWETDDHQMSFGGRIAPGGNLMITFCSIYRHSLNAGLLLLFLGFFGFLGVLLPVLINPTRPHAAMFGVFGGGPIFAGGAKCMTGHCAEYDVSGDSRSSIIADSHAVGTLQDILQHRRRRRSILVVVSFQYTVDVIHGTQVPRSN